MIRSVEIKGLRGIREGKLTDLTPLVVLVGPNGSGKSTVLEGIFLGASPDAAAATVQVIRRHEAILHFVFKHHSVPATLAGDGIQSFLRLSLELAASGGGVALLEEPEVHMHPGAIRQSARAILAAVRRDIQVILTTHSLELIDSLVAESSDKDLGRMSLYRLQLQEGILKHSRVAGADVAFERTTVEVDLR